MFNIKQRILRRPNFIFNRRNLYQNRFGKHQGKLIKKESTAPIHQSKEGALDNTIKHSVFSKMLIKRDS